MKQYESPMLLIAVIEECDILTVSGIGGEGSAMKFDVSDYINGIY